MVNVASLQTPSFKENTLVNIILLRFKELAKKFEKLIFLDNLSMTLESKLSKK